MSSTENEEHHKAVFATAVCHSGWIQVVVYTSYPCTVTAFTGMPLGKLSRGYRCTANEALSSLHAIGACRDTSACQISSSSRTSLVCWQIRHLMSWNGCETNNDSVKSSNCYSFSRSSDIILLRISIWFMMCKKEKKTLRCSGMKEALGSQVSPVSEVIIGFA